MTSSDDRTDRALDVELTHVTAEIARCDTKAGLLLALAGAGLAVAGSGVTDYHLPVAAQIVGGCGAAAVVAAIVALLLAVRPDTGGTSPVGWPRWATCTPDQMRQEVREDGRAERICALARIAARKMRGIRTAVHLLLAGIGCLALSALAAIAIP